ncbi:hypothetical protein F4677DRAFT_461575 [Hypoxylon crocopeplum]|nr:hypothetical protein F4677DRAFT_461575 [Hypoxylon crocopeplum]
MSPYVQLIALAVPLFLWSSVPVSVAAAAHARQVTTRVNSGCKVIPGDSAWPNQQVWDGLNQTVGGRLIATVSQAAVCHPGGYAGLLFAEAECDVLASDWNLPQTFEGKSGEIMNPWYQNASCSPYYRTDQPCELGNYVSYAISVSSPEDVAAAINFTQRHNVRLVIKNTGHDFLGKSTGKGSLSLWTHNLKSISIAKNYTSAAYTGPAIKIGAGYTGGEVLLYAAAAGYTVVSGDCPTVGVSGGYSAGGGHGLLNGAYGLAADNVLEWEVVTADGRHLTASPAQNADLYWALTGGGAGTYAVVLSMTAKAHPEGHLGAATLSFNATASPSNATYAAALDAWWRFLPAVVDTGAAPAFNYFAGGFLVYNTTAPGKTAEDMATLFQPYLAELDTLGVPYTFATYTAPSYLEHYNATNGPLPYGPYQGSELFNSRFIPRAAAEGEPERITAAMIEAMDLDPAADFQFGCMGLNVNETRIQHPDNAVVPYWRDAVAVCLEFSAYDWTVPEATMLARRQELANTIHPLLVDATPGSGAYLNEADPLVYPQGDTAKWQDAFYGTNYARLRQIKDAWDPHSVFYAFTAVGSEDWTEGADGRLCRV